MDERINAVLSRLREQLAALYGTRLCRLVLFGSRARGDNEADSDIDVLVVLKGTVVPAEEIARTGGVVAALSLEHGVVISCVFVSESSFDHDDTPLLLNVRREGVPV